jgi:hypothetical protein
MPSDDSPILPSLVLSNDAAKARAELQQYLTADNVGILLSLGSEGADGFTISSGMAQSQPGIGVSAVWAKDPEAVRPIIQSLQNGGHVIFGPNGHRMVSINKLDQVSRVLSLFESKRLVSVLGAFWCAARTDKACDF